MLNTIAIIIIGSSLLVSADYSSNRRLLAYDKANLDADLRALNINLGDIACEEVSRTVSCHSLHGYRATVARVLRANSEICQMPVRFEKQARLSNLTDGELSRTFGNVFMAQFVYSQSRKRPAFYKALYYCTS